MGKTILLFLTVIVALTACAPQIKQMSRKEFMSATQKEYKNVDQEKILSAAEKLFVLSDGSDYKFVYKKNKLTAIRYYNVFYVMSTHQGNYIWDIAVESRGNKSIVSVNVENRSGGFLAPTFTRPSNEPAIFDLFYRRLNNLLGLSNEWLTCAAAKQEYQKRGDIWGSLGPLCYVTTDKAPIRPGGQTTQTVTSKQNAMKGSAER